ncbi:hypothetical protein MKW94_005894 [Papaver nudicaule]|uniref:Uncharacterized protein n=1 Tax=Papaver nudicaule TaxID=74823 RepID=A0AA41RV83_PAPNU|nr:hypothetical protein [Papaver nudicaule]
MLRITSEEQISKVLSTVSLLNPCGTINPGSFPRVIVDYQGQQHPCQDAFGVRRGRGGSRIIRTPIRPLFPPGFIHDVQVMARVLRCSEQQDVDVIAANATSAALMLSDIPWAGPIGVVRIGRIQGEFVVNPVMYELPCCDIDLIYACTLDKTLMVDVQAREVEEEDLEAALKLAHQEAVKCIKPQIELAKQAGTRKKDYKLSMMMFKKSTVQRIESLAEASFEDALFPAAHEKSKGVDYLAKVTADAKRVLEVEECDEEQIKLLQPHILDKLRRKIFYRWNVENGIRLDGRRSDEVRRVKMSAGLHEKDEAEPQAGFVDSEHLHFFDRSYRRQSTTNYPRYLYKTRPFRVDGDWKKWSHNSCEAENGSFIENALVALLPKEDFFPYVVRLNSQIVCHDGSASTASVCGGSIALMDAGVPQRGHVAGVSMGLVREVHFGNTEYQILTDLSSLEEQLGDMSFKVAGSWKRITALQLDLNVAGVPLEVICKCLGPASKARLQILNRMEKAISVPRYCVSNDWYWPYLVIAKYFLPVESFKRLINPGPGRYAEKKCFQRDTGARIIASTEDGGIITVVAMNKTSHMKVLREVETMDGIEIEVDYSRYYYDFDAGRQFMRYHQKET